MRVEEQTSLRYQSMVDNVKESLERMLNGVNMRKECIDIQQRWYDQEHKVGMVYVHEPNHFIRLRLYKGEREMFDDHLEYVETIIADDYTTPSLRYHAPNINSIRAMFDPKQREFAALVIQNSAFFEKCVHNRELAVQYYADEKSQYIIQHQWTEDDVSLEKIFHFFLNNMMKEHKEKEEIVFH